MHEEFTKENPILNTSLVDEAHTPSKSTTNQRRGKTIMTIDHLNKGKALQIEEDEEESLPATIPLGRSVSIDCSASKSFVLESILSRPPNERMPTTRNTGMLIFLSISLCLSLLQLKVVVEILVKILFVIPKERIYVLMWKLSYWM